MKRDFDLIRQILLEIEAHESLEEVTLTGIKDTGSDAITYHLILMDQAGLLLADSIRNNHRRIEKVVPYGISWSGHEYLNSIRDNNIWNDIKIKLKDGTGAVTFELIKKVAYQLAAKGLDL